MMLSVNGKIFVFLFFCSVVITLGTMFVNKCQEYTVHKLPHPRLDWNQSKDFCSKNGSHLVCIEHQDELDFLEKKLKEMKLAGGSEYFIGLEERNGVWKWICNTSIVITPKEKPWAISEPSGDTSCAKMYFYDHDFLVYDDILCSHKEDYICERRISKCAEKGRCKYEQIYYHRKLVNYVYVSLTQVASWLLFEES